MAADTKTLENHTFQFAQAVREFGKVIRMTVSNVEDLKQLVRASGKVGANYIAATTAPNKATYLLNIKECGQEALTTNYWLGLIDTQGAAELEHRRKQLMKAAQDLAGVFAQILKNK